MTRKINYTTTPTDFVRFFLMDGNGNNITGSNNATVTNEAWTTSSFSYIKQQLSWGASTTFTYSSFTYTNSYLIKNGNVIKNSGEVGATALSGVNGNTYQGLIFFNRTLTAGEELAITQYAKRKLGPSNAILSGDFPLYSLPNLEQGKVLEISKPKVGSNYINQVDGSTYAETNVTDSTNGKYNVMSFNGSTSIIGLGVTSNTYNINGNHTILLTFKTTTSKTNHNIFASGENPTFRNEGVYIRTTTALTYRRYDGTNIDITFTYTNGKIYRVACVYDNTNNLQKLYVDGILIGSIASTTITSANTINTEFGRLFTNGANNFAGELLNPSIISRVMSDAEILQDYYAHKIV